MGALLWRTLCDGAEIFGPRTCAGCLPETGRAAAHGLLAYSCSRILPLKELAIRGGSEALVRSRLPIRELTICLRGRNRELAPD